MTQWFTVSLQTIKQFSASASFVIPRRDSNLHQGGVLGDKTITACTTSSCSSFWRGELLPQQLVPPLRFQGADPVSLFFPVFVPSDFVSDDFKYVTGHEARLPSTCHPDEAAVFALTAHTDLPDRKEELLCQQIPASITKARKLYDVRICCSGFINMIHGQVWPASLLHTQLEKLDSFYDSAWHLCSCSFF